MLRPFSASKDRTLLDVARALPLGWHVTTLAASVRRTREHVSPVHPWIRGHPRLVQPCEITGVCSATAR